MNAVAQPAAAMRVAVIGATGRTGRHVVTRLCDLGHDVVAVGRTPQRFPLVDRRARIVAVDLDRPQGLAEALAGCARVVSCAHAKFTAAILAALPASAERFVAMGSVRRYLPIADADGESIRDAEALLATASCAAVMLHASMIYGSLDDGNTGRILGLMRRWPRWLPLILPLPGGGRHTVQPIFVEDVAKSVVAALVGPEPPARVLVLAGPEPLTYAAMVRACAQRLGRRAVILPVPVALLIGLARLLGRIGVALPLSTAELRRAAIDKRFDIAEMRRQLGIEPIEFAEGLRRIAIDPGRAEGAA